MKTFINILMFGVLQIAIMGTSYQAVTTEDPVQMGILIILVSFLLDTFNKSVKL
jgi:hypothetical protein